MNNLILKGLLIFFAFFSFTSYGQNVEIVDENEFSNKAIKPETFDFIDKAYKY